MIKFRAWIISDKRYGELLSINFVDKIVAISNSSFDLPGYSEYEFDEIILEQYTGLKDSNGVDIYEGDIVRVLNYCNHDIIFFRAGTFALQPDENHPIISMSNIQGQYRILGNIHENP